MSTQQILGVVGGVIGAYFGYPQLGFVVGSLIGAALTPATKTEGPKLDDLKVTVSTYGGGIPTVYGTMRVGGNVIWSTDKIQIPTTTSSDGKGGGTENTTYQYFVHMAIALCYGPITGIRKIWKDGKLIYDASSGVSVGSAIASATSPYSFLTFYPGTESQLPDPIQEVYLGAGNAPAYRGIAYVQMNAVECPGGRVPQFSFEVTTSPADFDLQVMETTGDDAGFLQSDGIYSFQTNLSTYVTTVHWSTEAGTLTTLRELYLGTPYVTWSQPSAVQGADTPRAIQAWGINPVDGAKDTVRIIELDTGEIREIYRETFDTGRAAIGIGTRPHSAYDTVSSFYAVVYDFTDAALAIVKGGGVVYASPADMADIPSDSPVAFYNGIVYVLKIVSGDVSVVVFDGEDGSRLGEVPDALTFDAIMTGAGISADASGVQVYHRGGSAGHISKVSFGPGYTSGTWTRISATVPDVALSSGQPTSNFVALPTLAFIGPDTAGRWRIFRYNAFDPDLVSVADIISSQCLRAGLDAADFDVGAIADQVWGYTITNPASARNNIQPLMTAYAIDATEEDGKIKFFKRSAITSAATLTYDELGCAEAGTDPGDPMPLSRGQEAELPRSVSVSYINPVFDYQTGTEKAIRQVTESQNDQTIEIAIATSADHAATVAQMILYDTWNERNKRSFKVSRKYAFVSAGDGVTFTFADRTLQLWRITKVTDTGALIEWEGVPADATLYTQTAIGATGYAAQEVAPLAPPVSLAILDMPILRDADNNGGLYAAMAPYSTSGYRGATLFVGDDESNLVPEGGVTNAAVIGTMESDMVYGSGLGGPIDYASVITVNVGAGTLSSTTWDGIFTNKENVAAIQGPGYWKIFQFRLAASLGGGRYALSELLRDLRGTDSSVINFPDPVPPGARFVLMTTAGMVRTTMDVGALNQAKLYKAVSLGRTTGSSLTYANTGMGLKPFAPINARRSVTAGGDIVWTWDRRTRLSESWLAGMFPVGETSERYQVVIYSSTSYEVVKRVIDCYAPTVTYTAAQIAADGYSLVGLIPVHIYQMSDAVGRGVPFQRPI